MINVKNKLRFILLIDDDEATNHLNSIRIRRTGITEEIKVTPGSNEALRFLSSDQDASYGKPDIIFLDINMPGMNGWEFLDHYKMLEDRLKAKVLLMMTSSLNPDDMERSKGYSEVDGFMVKPLTTETLLKAVAQYFPGIIA